MAWLHSALTSQQVNRTSRATRNITGIDSWMTAVCLNTTTDNRWLSCNAEILVRLLQTLTISLSHFDSVYRNVSYQSHVERQSRGITHLHVFDFRPNIAVVCSNFVPRWPSRIDTCISSEVCQEKHSLHLTLFSARRSLLREQMTMREATMPLQKIRFVAYGHAHRSLCSVSIPAC